jgi:hypothetical protein
MSQIVDRDVRVIPDELAATLSRGERRALLRHMKAIVPMAGGDGTMPDPLGTSIDSANRVVVADYVNPPSRIPALIRDLVAENEGYFIERIFRTPGFTVQGGAILYKENYPNDHFLATGQSLAPRSPGSEAPVIGVTRRAPKLARPESWAGSIEVTDEVRRWNDVIEVQDQFRKAANTFADVLQRRGEETLADFVQASGRFVVGGAGTFGDWAAADPVENTSSTDNRPSAEFARVARLFAEDKTGVRPDTVIMSPEDAEHLDRVYGDRLPALLARHNLTLIVSPRRTTGRRLYVRSGQVGVLAFDKPLGDPEITREGKRFTTSYTLEAVPVFVANGGDALLEVRHA